MIVHSGREVACSVVLTSPLVTRSATWAEVNPVSGSVATATVSLSQRAAVRHTHTGYAVS
jgi:hypothetical protein